MSAKVDPPSAPANTQSITSSTQSPPSSSAASTKSQNEPANSKPTKSNSNASITTNSPPNGEFKRPPPVKKPTMTSRISGMFKRDTSEASARDVKSVEPIRETAVANASITTSSNVSPASSSRATTATPTGIVSVGSDKIAAAHPPSTRFYMTDDGLHEHYLKVAKRNQKLKDMVSGLWRKKEGQEELPLTLMHDWVLQKRTEQKASPDLKGGPNHSLSLVEKYGKCQEIVGHGAFGIVRVAHKIDPKEPKKEQLFAVKEFHKRPGESAKRYQKRLTSEFCLSSSMQHPNVIQTLDLLQDDKGDYCEVMEFCSGGDLYTLILAAGTLEVLEADCYMKQLMRGVEYMHEMGVAHRDLKPENLLLTTHGALKITDFGNGECFRMAWEKEAHMTAGLCGSQPYIAPEEYVDKEFDPRAVDVWACGVIYMAMRTGRHLWRVAQKGEDEFFTRYLEDRREESGFRPIEVLRRRQCRNVIYSVLDPNPIRRLTAHQVLQSEWVKEIKVCKAGEEGF